MSIKKSASKSHHVALPEQSITISKALIAAINQEKNAHDATLLPYLPRAVVAEAQSVVDALTARYLAAPTSEELKQFVPRLYDALNAIVCNPADDRALSVRSGIACAVLADVPRVVLSSEFELFCFSRCKFLPTPADLLEMAKEFARPKQEQAARVRMIITHDRCKRFTLGTRPDDEAPPSRDVRDAHHSIVVAFPSQREKRHG